MMKEENTKNEIKENIQELIISAIENSDISIITNLIEKYHNEVIELLDESEMTIIHRSTFLSMTLITQTMIEILKNKLKKENLKIFINKKCVNGYTALHYASFRGNIDLIETLIENGADYLEKSLKGLTVLHLAAQGDKPESLIYFKEKYNMDILERDFNGSTPLHWASFMGCENAIKFLLTWMDDVNIKEHMGYTPFHLAVFSERTRILKKLYHKGAKIDAVDNKGRTALQIAIENNKQNIVEMLSDKYPFGQWVCKPPFTYSNNSYFNVYFFIFTHLLGQSVCLFYLLPYFNSTLFLAFYLTLQIIVYVIFTILIFSNPGFVENCNKITLLQLVMQRAKINEYCPMCVVHLTFNTKHCYYCEKCINEFDHHCIWVHNCIGKSNVNYFITFLSIVLFNLIVNFYIAHTVYNSDSDIQIILPSEYDVLHSHSTLQYISALLMVVCLIFSIPVVVILIFQLKSKLRFKTKLNDKKNLDEENDLLII